MKIYIPKIDTSTFVTARARCLPVFSTRTPLYPQYKQNMGGSRWADPENSVLTTIFFSSSAYFTEGCTRGGGAARTFFVRQLDLFGPIASRGGEVRTRVSKETYSHVTFQEGGVSGPPVPHPCLDPHIHKQYERHVLKVCLLSIRDRKILCLTLKAPRKKCI